MAEALCAARRRRFEVHSAGTEPRGINPLTLRVLAEAGIDASWARSKSVTSSSASVRLRHHGVRPGPPGCPVFPGVHEMLHWGYEDPAAVDGTDEERSRLPPGLHRARRADPPVRAAGTTARRCRVVIELHLLRHAHAGDPRRGRPGRGRPLSTRARSRRTGSAGSWPGSVRADAIITSPRSAPRRPPRSWPGTRAPDSTIAWPARSTRTLEALLRDAAIRPAGLVGTTRTSAILADLSGRDDEEGRASPGSTSSGRSRPAVGTLRWLVPPDLLKPAR